MAVAGGQRAFQITGRRRDGALVAHGRLHDDGGNVAARQPRFQGRQIVPAQHVEADGIAGILALAAGHKGRRLCRTGGILGGRSGPEDIVEPAMIMAFEFQDDALARGGARQTEGGLRHFRA